LLDLDEPLNLMVVNLTCGKPNESFELKVKN